MDSLVPRTANVWGGHAARSFPGPKMSWYGGTIPTELVWIKSGCLSQRNTTKTHNLVVVQPVVSFSAQQPSISVYDGGW
jgi:hypothetical protein